MKILVIDDDSLVTNSIAYVLSGMGDVVTCTASPSMPRMNDVLSLITEADVIFLDNNLGTSYEGKDLYPYCKGKKVIGISREVAFGDSNYCLISGGGKSKTQIFNEMEFFRGFVQKAIAN